MFMYLRVCGREGERERVNLMPVREKKMDAILMMLKLRIDEDILMVIMVMLTCYISSYIPQLSSIGYSLYMCRYKII